MDKVLIDLADRYTATQQEGQRFIKARWHAMTAATRLMLTGSGFYSDRGERLESGGYPDAASAIDCETLEYSLGLYKRAVISKLPRRDETGKEIPREALDSELTPAARTLLQVREWHDPEFLRLALQAVCVHEKATAMWLGGPPEKYSVPMGCAGSVLRLVLVLAMPAAFAIGITSSIRQELGAACLAFYVLGAGVLACVSKMEAAEKNLVGHSLAYDRWTRFELDGAASGAGAGAAEHLRSMAQDGVKVPSLAFDLARLLYDRTSKS